MSHSSTGADAAGAPVQSGPERVRSAVIDTARRMFAERGIHAVSVREIAKEVGVSHTLLHLYFGSKDEIVRQVLNSFDPGFVEDVKSAAEVETAISEVFKKVAGLPDSKVLASALLEGIVPDRIGREAIVTRAIAERLENSNGFDPRVVSAAVASMMLGWAVGSEWLRRSVDFGDMSEEELLDQVSQLLEHWVRNC